jgi:hypothetical protein
MALAIGEANAFFTVAEYLLGIDGASGPVSDERALAALLLLREKAFKTLSAGPTEEQIRGAFEAINGEADQVQQQLTAFRAAVPPVYGVLAEVAAERERQDAKWGEQNHPDGTDTEYSHVAESRRAICQTLAAKDQVTWKAIADEEIWEAYAEADPPALRKELVQVASVFIAWVEAIDRRTAVAP